MVPAHIRITAGFFTFELRAHNGAVMQYVNGGTSFIAGVSPNSRFTIADTNVEVSAKGGQIESSVSGIPYKHLSGLRIQVRLPAATIQIDAPGPSMVHSTDFEILNDSQLGPPYEKRTASFGSNGSTIFLEYSIAPSPPCRNTLVLCGLLDAVQDLNDARAEEPHEALEPALTRDSSVQRLRCLDPPILGGAQRKPGAYFEITTKGDPEVQKHFIVCVGSHNTAFLCPTGGFSRYEARFNDGVRKFESLWQLFKNIANGKYPRRSVRAELRYPKSNLRVAVNIEFNTTDRDLGEVRLCYRREANPIVEHKTSFNAVYAALKVKAGLTPEYNTSGIRAWILRKECPHKEYCPRNCAEARPEPNAKCMCRDLAGRVTPPMISEYHDAFERGLVIPDHLGAFEQYWTSAYKSSSTATRLAEITIWPDLWRLVIMFLFAPNRIPKSARMNM